jgi:hypothetical protein
MSRLDKAIIQATAKRSTDLGAEPTLPFPPNIHLVIPTRQNANNAFHSRPLNRENKSHTRTRRLSTEDEA